MSLYIDQITIKRVETLHPKLVGEGLRIVDIINNERLTGRSKFRCAYGIRTFTEQADLFAQGRTKPGKIVTKARAGMSYHNYGLAMDGVLMVDKDGNGTYEAASWDFKKDWDSDLISDWDEVVQVFKEFGWVWGSDWNNNGSTKDESFLDAPHFQKTFGLSVRECLDRYNAGKFIPNTKYIKI